jgi:hypothetical protein
MLAVHVVAVVAVPHGNVPAVGAVLMLVLGVRDVAGELALVPVPIVAAVCVAVVKKVLVLAVRHGHMTAVGPVIVLVVAVRLVIGCHGNCPADSSYSAGESGTGAPIARVYRMRRRLSRRAQVSRRLAC